MQFQVPQFIDTEDKIVGPLSLRQFAFVAAGGILSAILYFSVQPWLWIICSIIIFGAAIALAFVKVEGRPFASVLVSAFNFYWKPQTYVWQPEHPVIHPHPEKVRAEEGKSALEDILAQSATKMATMGANAPSQAARVFAPKRQSPPPETEPVVVARPEVKKEMKTEVKPEIKPEVKVEVKAEVKPEAKVFAPTIAARVASPVQPAKSIAQHEEHVEKPKLVTRAAVSIGSALHKSWEDLQTGAPFAKKESDKEFLDRKMVERYQIFRRISGDKRAAKRVDYR
jgi:hypothetical protein